MWYTSFHISVVNCAILFGLCYRAVLVNVEVLEQSDLRVPLVSLAATVNLVCQDPR